MALIESHLEKCSPRQQRGYPPSPTERLAFVSLFLWAELGSFVNDQIGFKVNRNIAYKKQNHVLELTSEII